MIYTNHMTKLPRKTVVIPVGGPAQNGKDTIGGKLETALTSLGKKVLVIHHADLLKYMAKSMFGWDGQKDEKGRTLLQYVGTDVISSQQPNYWVNFVISILKFFESEWDYVLIPDCRYQAEVTRMKEEFDTLLLRVERPNFESGLTEKQKQHVSETSMDNYDFDAVIQNDSTLESFRSKLELFMATYLL
jgi:hypothetical protein